MPMPWGRAVDVREMLNAELVTITEPTSEPVLDAYDHLYVDESEDESYVIVLVVVARQWVERYTGLRLISQTTELQLDGWGRDEVLSLRTGPVQSVDSVKYDDQDDTEQTLDASKYWVDTQSMPARLTIKGQWPSLQAGKPAAVRIRMTTGYADAASVPAPIKHAIKLLVGHLFENREQTSAVEIKDVPFAAESLLEPYRLERW